MKIDYICTGYHPVVGGTEILVRNIAERMSQKGHDVTVHTSTYSPNYSGKLQRKEVINGVKVFRSRLFPFFIFFPRIKKPGIVHLFSFGDNFMIQSFLRRRNMLITSPIGEEMYSSYKKRVRFMGKHALNFSRVIAAQTEYEKNILVDTYGIDSNKIIVWPAGVDDSAFSSPDLNNVRKTIENISEFRYFIRVARIDRFKELEFGIKMLPNLPGMYYVISGVFQDNDYLNELKGIADKLGVSDRLVFTGRISDDEKRFLLRHTVFYLLANHETFGTATVEAMAQGIPVLAANVKEYTGIIFNNINSLVYEYGNVEDATEKAMRLINNDVLINKLGENGIDIAKKNFMWDKLADIIEKIYMAQLTA